MTWAALTSGGKDSILALQKAIDLGMNVSYMVTVVPQNLESYMFHSVNLAAVPIIAARCGMTYVKISTPGYKEEELCDLETGLSTLPIEGVIVGTIESEYQRSRIATLCERLGLAMFAPLWHMDPVLLLHEVAEKMDVRIVVTAADGLGENILGRRLDSDMIDLLCRISLKRRIHVAGEGGEYESLTLNAPCFSLPVRCDGWHTEFSCGRGVATIERFW
ncbi:MAG TPA: diphthine--ammonia ligase [Methanocorpusculum sp.]|nr:diphthine--ammonia ligase [Methanocorpusculum sp.]HJK00745.1 diphthine--ammonia ligase [Methanocorpusculum sp.]HJK02220.1 diphthine--ammonia ligase [Methanocorpusculum sp.]